jgi:hypothetical protein
MSCSLHLKIEQKNKEQAKIHSRDTQEAKDVTQKRMTMMTPHEEASEKSSQFLHERLS